MIEVPTRQLNANAAEFIPSCNTRVQVKAISVSGIENDLVTLIINSGLAGTLIQSIPVLYRSIHQKELDLSLLSYADLSVFVEALVCRQSGDVILVPSGSQPPRSLEDAMKRIGLTPPSGSLVAFNTSTTVSQIPLKQTDNASSSFDSTDSCPVGHLANRFVQSLAYSTFCEDLLKFKNDVIALVEDFNRRNSSAACLAPPGLIPPSDGVYSLASNQQCPGLALSLFAAEWEKRFRGSQNFKDLRDKFQITKLMPFLQSIPELDIVGSHPEVRAKLKSVGDKNEKKETKSIQSLLALIKTPRIFRKNTSRSLSREELKTLLYRLINSKASEILTTQRLKDEWEICYPSLQPLFFYEKNIHAVLREIENVALLGDRIIPMLFSSSSSSSHMYAGNLKPLQRAIIEIVKQSSGITVLALKSLWKKKHGIFLEEETRNCGFRDFQTLLSSTSELGVVGKGPDRRIIFIGKREDNNRKILSDLQKNDVAGNNLNFPADRLFKLFSSKNNKNYNFSYSKSEMLAAAVTLLASEKLQFPESLNKTLRTA